eukprot:9095309-Alexandrium_andersonii.AAC.1
MTPVSPVIIVGVIGHIPKVARPSPALFGRHSLANSALGLLWEERIRRLSDLPCRQHLYSWAANKG